MREAAPPWLGGALPLTAAAEAAAQHAMVGDREHTVVGTALPAVREARIHDMDALGAMCLVVDRWRGRLRDRKLGHLADSHRRRPKLQVGQIRITDVAVIPIPALEHQTHCMLSCSDALSSAMGCFHALPGLVGGIETLVPGAGHDHLAIAVDEPIWSAALTCRHPPVEVVQGSACQLAGPWPKTWWWPP